MSAVRSERPVIVQTAQGSIETAIKAMRAGADDFVVKPINPERLRASMQNLLKVTALTEEVKRLNQKIGRALNFDDLIASSPAMAQVVKVGRRAAQSAIPVLIEGESGVGKEMIARAIQGESERRGKPFVAVNCGALPENLVESILFGHEKGAFTGATVRAAGAFERAHGGTLLLDEISEMRLDLQSKLLRVIQEQEFERVGGHQPIQVDVRLIATTNRDLKAEVEGGRFREDLYYRLNVVPIHAPSLRERLDDIPRLVHHFVTRATELHGGTSPTIAPETLQILPRYSWPGNVRELANAVERAVILCRGSVLQPTDFDQQIRDAAAHPSRPAIVPDAAASGGAGPIDYNLDAVERLAIERALAATGGNRTRAARLLGISERTLRNKLNSPRAASGS
jgi:DNA-binding NtrC family response regulator